MRSLCHRWSLLSFLWAETSTRVVGGCAVPEMIWNATEHYHTCSFASCKRHNLRPMFCNWCGPFWARLDPWVEMDSVSGKVSPHRKICQDKDKMQLEVLLVWQVLQIYVWCGICSQNGVIAHSYNMLLVTKWMWWTWGVAANDPQRYFPQQKGTLCSIFLSFIRDVLCLNWTKDPTKKSSCQEGNNLGMLIVKPRPKSNDSLRVPEHPRALSDVPVKVVWW